MNADAYKGFAERYDLSFGQFGEHEPQIVEFFRRLCPEQRSYCPGLRLRRGSVSPSLPLIGV